MSTLPTTITSKWLAEHEACAEDLALFEEEWPEGGAVTKESLTRASELGLDLDWLARRLLPKLMNAVYRANVSLLAEDYRIPRASLLLEYSERRAPLVAAFNVERTALYKEYKTIPSLEACGYSKDIRLLRAKYAVKCSPLEAYYTEQRLSLETKLREELRVLTLQTLLSLYELSPSGLPPSEP